MNTTGWSVEFFDGSTLDLTDNLLTALQKVADETPVTNAVTVVADSGTHTVDRENHIIITHPENVTQEEAVRVGNALAAVITQAAHGVDNTRNT